MMRTLGILFLAVILAAALAFGAWKQQDRQARDYVSRAIPAIFARWDEQMLDARLIRELQKPAFKRESGDMLERLGELLGPLASAEEPQGALEYGRPDPSLPRAIFGKYQVPAKFGRGEGTIEILVVKQDHAWRIGSYRVSSPTLSALQKPGLQPDGSVTLHRGPAEIEAEVMRQATGILQRLDADDSGACWDNAAPVLRQKVSRAAFVTALRKARRTIQARIGEPHGREVVRAGFTEDLPESPTGEYSVLEFESNYPGHKLEERIVLLKYEGRWLLFGYQWRV